LGLVVNTVRVEAGDPKKIGFVITQDPRGQSLVLQGDTVTIFIGTAKGGGAGGGGNGGGGGGGGG
jgi:beta-lactam-binding protein with PASTA domain